MVGRDIMVRHLPERVLRQYGYGQTQPRPPTEIEALGQMMWPRPSQSLLYMSSAINRGVIRFRITSRRVNLGGTWDDSLEYHILLWSPVQPFLTTLLMPLLALSLLTRRFLLSSSGPNILPTHTRSSATSEPEWAVQWGILLCFIIRRRLCAWYMAYSLSGACWSRCRLRGGGVGFHRMEQYDFCVVFLWHFVRFCCNPITFALFGVFMTFFVVLFHYFL